MQTEEQLKEIVRKKYSEIALQDKKPTCPLVVVQVDALQRYIIL